jgi:hypothetical protein
MANAYQAFIRQVEEFVIGERHICIKSYYTIMSCTTTDMGYAAINLISNFSIKIKVNQPKVCRSEE